MEERKWLDIAKKLQSIAQAGLEYSKDKYDLERFEEIRKVSIDIMECYTDIEREKIMTQQVTSSAATQAKPENNQIIKISNEYYLIIGFEVNLLKSLIINGKTYERAFNKATNTQDLTVEDGYGHNYFITVKNGVVDTFFSFGPGVDQNAGTPQQIQDSALANPNFLERRKGIDEYSGKRPGNTGL